MEADSSGIHIVRPASKYLSSDSAETLTAYHAWWLLTVMDVPPFGSPEPKYVSHKRVFSERAIESAQSVDVGSGLFEVRITTKAAGIDALASMALGDDFSEYIDWFGEPKLAGDDPTELSLVLVHENVGFREIPVAEILAAGAQQPITVARALDQSTADEIVASLGF